MLAIPVVGTAAIYAAVYSTEFGRAVMAADPADTFGEARLLMYLPLLVIPAGLIGLLMMWHWVTD